MLKPILTFSLIISMCFLGISQSNQDELQLMQSLYGMEKRDIVAEFVELSEAQENEFWVLYDEYENKRKALGQERFDLLQRYVNDYGEVRPENAENFMKQAIPIRIKTDKLRDTYYQKIKSRTDPVVAMQFYQIENYLSDAIRMELLEEIYTTKKQ
ncbi:hypothetical protein [Lutimonas zeaxanthinifaciens]|uniref:hypothetical protein n=1 Tax=Lutimonas zeaxanthinifaciens TaxID=3060215 RepID=UPI00265CBED9|nr:hypothetical protein [Lutimonas sp. YSD2104]WKK64641.1 hypothetical protein QZH61_08560 [Lutimonas sp. YSD2104]